MKYTTKIFIKKAKEKYGNLYDYRKVVYTGSRNNVIIICKKHGEFIKEPAQHIRKRGNGHCPECIKEKSKPESKKDQFDFIMDSVSVHGDRYDYSLVRYINNDTKVKIICPDHGIFEQKPRMHISGHGCNECKKELTAFSLTSWIDAATNSLNFDSYKIYVIRCWNKDESFIKIGRTFLSVGRRFKTKAEMPYEYKVLKIIEGSPIYIFKKEKKIHKMFYDKKYVPTIHFSGKYECFNISNEDIDLIT